MILSIVAFFKKFSKKPWGCFVSTGVEKTGLGIEMYWNDAFMRNLERSGFMGVDEQDTARNFFIYMSATVSGVNTLNADEVVDVVNPSATPKLSNDTNRFIQ